MILLPTLPSYIIARFARHLPLDPGRMGSKIIRAIPNILEALTEINLAMFYLTGAYYTPSSRILKIRYVSRDWVPYQCFHLLTTKQFQMSSVSVDPNSKPPSYSFLGILLSIRLLHRLYNVLHPYFPSPSLLSSSSTSEQNASRETYIDSTPLSVLLPSPTQLAKDAVEDSWGDRTILDLDNIPPETRTSQRKCALCLEERTASSVTECGHMFCWTCVVGWAREKVSEKKMSFPPFYHHSSI